MRDGGGAGAAAPAPSQSHPTHPPHPPARLSPLRRRRYLPDNSYEDWSLSELIIPER